MAPMSISNMFSSSLPPPQPRPAALARVWHLSAIMISLLFLSVGVRTTLAQDPINNFCRLFGHQAAVIDQKLYIDGGMINYQPFTEYPNNYTNLNLFYEDLSVVSSAGMPNVYSNLTKNSSVPSVSGGTLWADNVNKRLFLFGGEYANNNPVPSAYTLWSYDPLNDVWDSMGIQQITAASYGAGASVSDRGEGYYFGGWMSNSSVSGWGGNRMATSYLTKYDMIGNTFTNSSGPPDGIRRAEGVMLYLPVSDGGMLVYFGGVQDVYGNGTATAQTLDQIFLYDLDSTTWYQQNATGEVPENRRLFCAGATWASDQSSYNIYLYGGDTVNEQGPGFDDIYILTLPSFQWIKWWQDTPEGAVPHHSFTCNVVDHAQMIILGGYFPSMPNHCDAPNQWGTHNMDLGEENANKAEWNLYQTSESTYAVPSAIISAVGGGPTGGASATSPSGGYANANLGVLMTRKAVISSRTATRATTSATNAPSNGNGGGSSSSSSLSAGAVAGIAIGAVALAVAVAFGCLCVGMRRHRRNKMTKGPNGTAPQGVNPNTGEPWSPNSYAASQAAAAPMSHHNHQPSISGSQAGSHFTGAHPASPIELEAAPDSTVWHSPDGVTYGLVAPAGSVSPSQTHGPSYPGPFSQQHQQHQQQPYSPTSSPPLPPYFPGNNSPLGLGGEMGPTKVDSSGRMWVALSPSSTGGGMSPVREDGRTYGGDDGTWYSRANNGQAMKGNGTAMVEPQELPGHYHHLSPEDGASEVGGAPFEDGGDQAIRRAGKA